MYVPHFKHTQRLLEQQVKLKNEQVELLPAINWISVNGCVFKWRQSPQPPLYSTSGSSIYSPKNMHKLAVFYQHEKTLHCAIIFHLLTIAGNIQRMNEEGPVIRQAHGSREKLGTKFFKSNC